MAGRKTIDKGADGLIEGDSALGKSIEVASQQQQQESEAVVPQLQPPLQPFPAQAATYVYDHRQPRLETHVASPSLRQESDRSAENLTTKAPVQEQSREVPPNIRDTLKSLAKVDDDLHEKDGHIAELQVRVDELEAKVVSLEKELSKEAEEKVQTEIQLNEVKDKLKKAENESTSKVAELMNLLDQKEDENEKLTTNNADKEKLIDELKKQHETEKALLQSKIDSMNSTHIRELHVLELKLKDHEINQLKLTAELAEARRETFEVKALLAAEKRAQSEEKHEKTKEEHEKTKEELSKCKEERDERRRSSELSKEELRKLRKQMSSVSEDQQ